MFESQKQADPLDIHFESQNHYKHTHRKQPSSEALPKKLQQVKPWREHNSSS